jgi:hypothetical protein
MINVVGIRKFCILSQGQKVGLFNTTQQYLSQYADAKYLNSSRNNFLGPGSNILRDPLKIVAILTG